MKLLLGKRTDGRPVRIEYEDCGDTVPCYDLGGNLFEGFTSYFLIDGQPCWAQTPRDELKAAATPEAWVDVRLKNERRVLEGFDVDCATLTFEDGVPLWWWMPETRLKRLWRLAAGARATA